MKKINELNINIDKALIKEVQLKMTDNGLQVLVKASFLTRENKEVAEFMMGSDWYGDSKFDVPLELHTPAREIFERLTPVIYEKINGKYQALPAPKKETMTDCTCKPKCKKGESDCEKCKACKANYIPF